MALHYQSGTSVNNNSGSLMTYPISSNLLSDIAPNTGSNLAYSSGPIDGDDTDKAAYSAPFAKNTNNLIAMRSKNAIFNGIAVLINSSIYPAYVQSIKYIESRVTAKIATSIRSGGYNIFTGKFTMGLPTVSTDNFGTDNAARSSYAVPGSITFMVNGKELTTQNYPAKG